MSPHLHLAIASLIDVTSPKGPQWEFLVLFATLALGPVIVERARIPGLIGLLVGGYVIGPHGLGVIGSGNNTLPDLGQLGLLYLMFVAGVELDLNLLRAYRRSAVVFGLLTFALPMVAGTAVGLALGWEVAAAILLGSLLSSHTLITYPTVRDAGLASDPAVATVVGSTVLTDTLALVVLAGVAGSVGGGRSTLDIAVQIAVGLTVLVAFSLLVLPLLAAWAFRWLSAERTVRYVVAITAFLSAATVAELFGIEGIVGAFFAGLALNRLVPNEGQLMDRIGFFGGAVFIPVFLVSVGLILDPSVLVEEKTLELAGLFTVACLGGKALATALSARLLGFSRPQAGLLFSLSSAQAAATLAATVIGFQLGLFDSEVVNAVLAVILVSVLVSSIVGARASARLHPPTREHKPLGTRVVVGIGDPDTAPGALTIAVRIARADGGVVYPVLVVPESAPIAPRPVRDRFNQVIAAAGADGRPSTIVDRSLRHGAVRAGAAADATLVLVAEPAGAGPSESHADLDGPAAGTVEAEIAPPEDAIHALAPPVAIVRGSAERLGAVRILLEGDGDGEGRGGAMSVAAEMARRVAGGAEDRLDDGPGWVQSLAPGDVAFVAPLSEEEISRLPSPSSAMVVATLAEHHLQETSG
ncbi:MAG TPA: cation:proton antiporter [Solirubrobacteraceae bacterium]|nr:cation:proton antiporter [Solirubrobacteraceae bacterium]